MLQNCRSYSKLIGNKIADKTTSLGKTKSKEKEKNPNLKQQINFIGKLGADEALMFIIEKSEEKTFQFLRNSVSII